jgi:YidC/Oxa1 family membrane protein insertase
MQQYVIMRRFKVDNPIDQLIRRITGKPAELT